MSSNTFSFLVAILVVFLTWWLWKRNKNLPPGPWGIPFFGYYPFISSTPAKDLKILAEKYGSVFSFRVMGDRLIVVLNGASAIREVIVNRADEFLGRPYGNSLVSWVSHGIGITQEEGEAWREQRRFFLQSAKSFGFGKLELEEKIQDEIKWMLDDLRKTNGESTDVQFHVAYANNSIISHILFSKKFDKREFYHMLLAAFKDLVKLFVGKRHISVGYMLDVELMFSSTLRRARRGRDILRSFIDGVVEEHIRDFNPENVKDYVDAYLSYRQELLKTGSEKTFTLERLQANALNLFMEGTESVSFAIANFLAKLSKYPEVQEKIQAELDCTIGRERFPSWLDKQKLPYLDASIQEVYRTDAPFFLSTMYSNFDETTINGYRIPKRSVLIYNLSTIHYDSTVYPNPHKFDPTRFLDSEGKRIKREGPYAFGVGKRACIGESLGQMVVFITIGSILQSFTICPGVNEEELKMIAR